MRSGEAGERIRDERRPREESPPPESPNTDTRGLTRGYRVSQSRPATKLTEPAPLIQFALPQPRLTRPSKLEARYWLSVFAGRDWVIMTPEACTCMYPSRIACKSRGTQALGLPGARGQVEFYGGAEALRLPFLCTQSRVGQERAPDNGTRNGGRLVYGCPSTMPPSSSFTRQPGTTRKPSGRERCFHLETTFFYGLGKNKRQLVGGAANRPSRGHQLCRWQVTMMMGRVWGRIPKGAFCATCTATPFFASFPENRPTSPHSHNP